MRFVEVGSGEVCMPPTEDMIADRMGQWEASGRRDASMLAQAHAMLSLADGLDAVSLQKWVGDETGGAAGVADIQAMAGGWG